ncbi:TPA: hypothetical protein QIM84_005149 [Klebsiella variicola]|nr:hypothetical protein [Klebsiella variicola]
MTNRFSWRTASSQISCSSCRTLISFISGRFFRNHRSRRLSLS